MRGFFSKNKAILAVVLLFSVLLTSLPFLSSAAQTAHTVTTNVVLNLRAAASTSSAVIRSLSVGTVMTLLESSSDGWAHVSVGGDSGYVSTDYLQLPEGTDVEMSGTTTEYLNLRSGKGSSYPVSAVIPLNETVKVTDNSDENWAGVVYGQYTGYASKMYLIINFTLPKTTVPTTPSSTVASHRSVSFDHLPNTVTSSSGADKASGMILSSTKVVLDINGTSILSVMNGAGQPLNGSVSFTSSDTKVATVSSAGKITAVGSGQATVSVYDAATGARRACTVTVSSVVQPTEEPTQPPTDPPTEPPTELPTEPPTEPPTEKPAVQITLSSNEATVYSGCLYQLTAKSDAAVTWSSSDTKVATVSSDGIVTAVSAGSANITAKAGDNAAVCKLTVKSGSYVSISKTTATVTAGKTYLARSYTSGVSWSSGNTDVAAVNNGYIFAKNPGKCVVTVSTSKGAATMLVTVTEAAPIRFAYTSPNCALKNQTVTLIAITDTKRTAVRFAVTVGSSTVIVNATSSTKDGSTLVWKGTTTFSSAGTYKVAAYSQYNNKWSTCSDGSTTAFVSNTADKTTTACTARRASDEVISLIANFEGYISSIYDDPITGDPTVGYGRVIFSDQQFYNTMTKNEAFAYLVQTVNNDGYTSDVNSMLISNQVRFNQQQFDALVCLVYNTGTGILSGDTELKNALLNCYDGGTGLTTYYINGTYVRIRTGPGTEYDVIRELEYNTEVTILSTENTAWTQVKLSDGTTGYVSSDYISKRSSGGNLDLNFVDRQLLIDKLCAYHHAGGDCIRGLLYRRVDELEMFFYGDYERNYGVYRYDINYTCVRNPSFHT